MFLQLGFFVTMSVTFRIKMSRAKSFSRFSLSEYLRFWGEITYQPMSILCTCISPPSVKKVNFSKLFLVSSTIFIAALYFPAQYKHVVNINGPLVKSKDFAFVNHFIWSLCGKSLIIWFWLIANTEHSKNCTSNSEKGLHPCKKYFK